MKSIRAVLQCLLCLFAVTVKNLRWLKLHYRTEFLGYFCSSLSLLLSVQITDAAGIWTACPNRPHSCLTAHSLCWLDSSLTHSNMNEYKDKSLQYIMLTYTYLSAICGTMKCCPLLWSDRNKKNVLNVRHDLDIANNQYSQSKLNTMTRLDLI